MSLAEGRLCLRSAIPELEAVAWLLCLAVAAHNEGDRTTATRFLTRANNQTVREWLGSVWGKGSPYTQYRHVANAPPVILKADRPKTRHITSQEKRLIHQRDGYYCRFCRIPVIRPEIRARIVKTYPAVVEWGPTNDRQHAAFQALWAQYDHITPHSRGGSSSLDNVVLTCAACNYGRMHYTLEEVGLADPRLPPTRIGPWDGLEGFRADAPDMQSMDGGMPALMPPDWPKSS